MQKAVKVQFRVHNKRNDVAIFIKAPALAKFFEQMSAEQYGGDARVSQLCDHDGNHMYNYYLLRNTPRVGISLAADPNILTAMAWMRSPDLVKGLWLNLSTPITRGMAKSMKGRLKANIEQLMRTVMDEFEYESTMTFTPKGD